MFGKVSSLARKKRTLAFHGSNRSIRRVALGAMTVELENKHGKVDWSCKTPDL